MNKKMTITYEVGEGLYINVTNRCSNACTFCIRNNGDGAYGADSLWLAREPSVDEILESVFSRDMAKYREVVFCGYGEPSYRLREIRELALKIKEKYPDMPIRINTNGQSDLILGEETAHFYKDAFDAVSISLNAPSADRYAEICRPVYKKAALPAIIEFTKAVKKFVPSVKLSVVREFITESELQQCIDIARELDVGINIRDYISD